MAKEFSGPEKAAVLLMSLGEEAASKVLSHMDEREIQNIGNYMASLGEVDAKEMDDINKEFFDMVSFGMGGLGVSGVDFLRNTLSKALDPDKAEEIINNITLPGDEMTLGGGIDTVRSLEPQVISSFLINEHPQTAAIILAHLDPQVASKAIAELPEENRTEIMYRLATLERVTPTVIRELDESLQQEFRSSGVVSGNKLGGVDIVAKMMGGLDRTTEQAILTEMDEVDQPMADQIRALRFTFEDILKIDDPGIQLILKEINQEDLLVGLKTASDELKEKLFTNMSERGAMMMKDDLESLGPTKISDVEKGQQKVIAVIKKLEEDGKVSVGGGSGDDQLV
jgi:flagellar motor switch protein FliG|tara:strand:- start:630 stop:1649 length:1020 start_codon:yes stop_codon:yes gene_type:complete